MNARAILLPMIAVGVALLAWRQTTPAGQGAAPAATWRVGPISDFEQARNFHELPPESPVRLSFSSGEARYVYVFSNSAEDGTLLLFPSPDISGSPVNPLAPGRTVLPGERDGEALAWTTRAEVLATTAYVIVASAAPVTELERLLPQLRRWSNQVLPNHSMQVTNPKIDGEVAGAPRRGWPSALLARAAARSLTETQVNGPLNADEQMPTVWSACVRVRERSAPAAQRAGGK